MIYQGDSRIIVPKYIKEGSVKMIITDPPYSVDYNWVWNWLSNQGHIMSENSHLVTLLGHSQLPIAIQELSRTFRYWWVGALTNKRSNKLFGKNVIVKWKPVLWFIKGKRKRENKGYFPFDLVEGTSIDFQEAKEKHKWGQPLLFFRNWIEHLTEPGDLVLDPFAGSGPVGKVCEDLERKYVLIDKEPIHAWK